MSFVLENQPADGRVAGLETASAAALVETIHRPSPDRLLGDISVLYHQLRGAHLANFQEATAPELYAYTGIALHVLNNNFTPHFRDIDLVTRPEAMQKLMDIIPTITNGQFRFITNSLKLKKVAAPLFPDIDSQRLSFQAMWFDEKSRPFVYEVEIWDNHHPEFIRRLLDGAELPNGIPTLEKDGFKVWHPWLIAFLYHKLQDHEKMLDLKQDRGLHRYQTMLAAQHAAHQLERANR